MKASAMIDPNVANTIISFYQRRVSQSQAIVCVNEGGMNCADETAVTFH